MYFHHFQNDPDKYSFVLTKSEPGISHGGPNSSHFQFFLYFVKNLTFWPKSIAHLGSHHLAEHNEAAHTPLDPPRRVSVQFFSLSRFCSRRNSFLKKMFGKPAPEGVIRVAIISPLGPWGHGPLFFDGPALWGGEGFALPPPPTPPPS